MAARLDGLGFRAEMFRTAAALAVLAISLGGCDDSDTEASALYDVQPSLRCFETLAPSEPPYVVGWRASAGRRGNLGQNVALMHTASYSKAYPAIPSTVNSVTVFFATSEKVARARFEDLFEDAKITGRPHQWLQRRSNVVLIWSSPATAREIATVTRCLRRTDA